MRKARKKSPGQRSGDVEMLDSAEAVLSGQSRAGRLKRILPFLGPAFIASVAYVDPGNFATNIQGGAQFGYMLLWVIVASNLMAMLIQTMSAKVGIVTGMNLAELCRTHLPRWSVIFMWVVMELVAMATDLAEFLGAALALNLLFGMPLFIAGILTAVITFLILGLERFGFRPMELVISALVGVVAFCYVIETLLVKPEWNGVLRGAFIPKFAGSESVLVAAGILGATVMPHAIFLHSALTQGRIVARDEAQTRMLYRYEIVDVFVAMTLAGAINAAMLIMAASTFHSRGVDSVGSLESAYRTLQPLLGPAAGIVFAVSLLASGLSSSSVGTMAGQVIMQGFIHRHIPVWLRRLVTLLPAMVVIGIGWDPTRSMVISQVVLSFGLPFAIIPLALFTSSRKIMGNLVNRRITTAAIWFCTVLVVLLNLYLIYQTMVGG
jgi:manganese transport protein